MDGTAGGKQVPMTKPGPLLRCGAAMLTLLLACRVPARAQSDVGAQELLSTVTIGGRCEPGACESGNHVFGAGEIVARTREGDLMVVTAYHVIAGTRAPKIFLRDDTQPGTSVVDIWRDGDARAASIVATSQGDDLALLAFRPDRNESYGFARLGADGAPPAGNVVGSPGGAAWTVSSFRLNGATDDGLDVRCASCAVGDSGGGVFGSDGRLAGIIVSQLTFVHWDDVARFRRRTNVFRAVTLDRLRTFLGAVGRNIDGVPGAPARWSHDVPDERR